MKCDLSFKPCNYFVNKEKTAFGTSNVDDNVFTALSCCSERILIWCSCGTKSEIYE